MKFPRRTLIKAEAELTAPKTRFIAFLGFFVIVFVTGGGSRHDIQSLLLLRPIAVLFCAYALIAKTHQQWRGRMFPLVIASLLFALMTLQLVPLPPSIWTEIPGRQIYAEIANIAGIEQPWRPLTLSPSRTLNSLFSLAVPVAGMMLYLNLDREDRKRAIPIIIVLCGISALLAMFQLAGPSQGPLYTYRITNFGTGVGLFANRNHQAVILASAIVMLGWYVASVKPNAQYKVLKQYGGIVTIFVLVPLIFVTGSRAGLILMIPALIMSLLLIYSDGSKLRPSTKGRGSFLRNANILSDRRVILAISISAIVGLVVLSVLLSRSLALDRLFVQNDLVELRLEILPTLFTMLHEYFPWGSGFGTFEYVYKVYEPQNLLGPTYLNHAHNDWLQFPIEGGVMAMLIIFGASIWFAKRCLILVKNWGVLARARYQALTCIVVILFLLASSIGDYPLRVPSIVAIFSVLVCILNDNTRSLEKLISEQR